MCEGKEDVRAFGQRNRIGRVYVVEGEQAERILYIVREISDGGGGQ